MDKLGWLNQHYLKNDDPADDRASNWNASCSKLGLELAQGPGAGRRRDRLARPRADVEGHGRARRGLVPAAGTATTKPPSPSTSTPRRAAPLAVVRERLAMRRTWTVESVSQPPCTTPRRCSGLGMGKVAQPLRVAITGTQVSPDISHTVFLAGREQALKRIDAALIKIPVRPE